MGDPFVGLIHPCKVYNVINVSAPILYIGPSHAHIPEILASLNGNILSASARHGEVEKVTEAIRQMQAKTSPRSHADHALSAAFSKSSLLPKLIAELEAAGT